MSLRRSLTAVTAAGALAAAGALSLAPAQAAVPTVTKAAVGQQPLAGYLLAPGRAGFDQNAKDFDIVTRAALAVLKAKPSSAVSVITDGSVPLTAFLPTDGAFRALVKDLTGRSLTSEKAIFAAVASLGIPTVEQVLLYHVVPGTAINARAALKANGAVLKTAQGGTIKVRVLPGPAIVLADKDPNSPDPRVALALTNINARNTQLAHGISRVLRPIDLPPTAGKKTVGTRSLAGYLLAPGRAGFDQNAKDFDIVTRAALAVLKAKPSSPVSAITKGSVPLTAFLPTDGAFRGLVKDLTGRSLTSEKAIFAAVASLGIPTVEQVLLYHVVPGTAINARAALKANGAVLKTAQGGTIGVRVLRGPAIVLADKDLNSPDPRVALALTNINAGNSQLAHGVSAVLRPVDLPPTHSR